MEKVINFINSNWQFIVFAAVALIELILLIIKKRSKVEIYDDSATSDLLNLVIKAESVYGSGNGSKKMLYVLTNYLERHPSLKGKGYEPIIKAVVERILESPQRKEKIDEKKNV